MQCAPLLYWLIVTEMRTHWPRTPDARHVSNVRNRQHNTQRRYLLHLALIVLYRVLFFPILTSSNIPSRRACPRSPPLIIFLGPAECTTAHCPHRGCTLFIIHFDEYFDLWSLMRKQLVPVLGEAAVAWSVTASNPLNISPSLWKAAAAFSLPRTEPSPSPLSRVSVSAAPPPTPSQLWSDRDPGHSVTSHCIPLIEMRVLQPSRLSAGATTTAPWSWRWYHQNPSPITATLPSHHWYCQCQ